MSQFLLHNLPVRPSLFWDVNVAELSTEKNKDFIIRRIFDRGTWDEILDLVLFYSEDVVLTSVLKAPSLRRATIYLASDFFKKAGRFYMLRYQTGLN